jgi:hypothetical protein
MGCGGYYPSPHFNALRGALLCANVCEADSSNIFLVGNIVLFSLFIWIEKTRIFYSLNFVFMDFFSATWLCENLWVGWFILSATNIIVILFICGQVDIDGTRAVRSDSNRSVE